MFYNKEGVLIPHIIKTLLYELGKKKTSANIPFNPFPYNDTFWCPWETSLLKTLWEEEKLLVLSNFSFTHSGFLPVQRTSCNFHQI